MRTLVACFVLLKVELGYDSAAINPKRFFELS